MKLSYGHFRTLAWRGSMENNLKSFFRKWLSKQATPHSRIIAVSRNCQSCKSVPNYFPTFSLPGFDYFHSFHAFFQDSVHQSKRLSKCNSYSIFVPFRGIGRASQLESVLQVWLEETGECQTSWAGKSGARGRGITGKLKYYGSLDLTQADIDWKTEYIVK